MPREMITERQREFYQSVSPSSNQSNSFELTRPQMCIYRIYDYIIYIIQMHEMKIYLEAANTPELKVGLTI